MLNGIEEAYMKIRWIEFENKDTGLKINRINFFDGVTLLIGLSGAGKTQILDAVHYSLSLALGNVKYIYPCIAELGIEINNHTYIWKYAIKRKKEIDILQFNNLRECYFDSESLTCDNTLVFSRKRDNINISSYNKIPTPRSNESLIFQYSEDEAFKEIVSNLEKIYPVDTDIDIRGVFDSTKFDELKSSINRIINQDGITEISDFSHLSTFVKLYIVKRYYPDIFEQILSTVQEVFPEINNISIVNDTERELYCIQIDVYGKKIHQKYISNGMLKTIYYIVELYTANDSSLILIDEFENGLGMNCIDAVSSIMLSERPDIQYIITSHHPKIINSIDYHSWRIIERNINVVQNYDCNDDGYDLGGSRHDAYYNLLNKWAYEGKI